MKHPSGKISQETEMRNKKKQGYFFSSKGPLVRGESANKVKPSKELRLSAGFTLIELLVVVLIIGILSSIILVAFATAQSRSRDGKRIADVGQIGKALELYYNDNAAFPASLNDLTTGPVVHLAVIPTAPKPFDNPIGGSACNEANNNYVYSSTDVTTYSLTFCLGGQTGSYLAGPHILNPTGIQ